MVDESTPGTIVSSSVIGYASQLAAPSLRAPYREGKGSEHNGA